MEEKGRKKVRRTRKYRVVRRRDPAEAGPKKESKRQVIVAHTIKPGQTIRLNDPKTVVRMPAVISPTHRGSPKATSPGSMRAVPQSLARGAPRGPRKDRNGNILGHTLLGTIEDFQAEEMALKGGEAGGVSAEEFKERPAVRVVPPPGEPGSPPSASVTRRGMVDRMRAEFKRARIEEDAIRSQLLHELPAPELRLHTRKERLRKKWEATTRRWEAHRRRIARKIGRDPELMVMHISDEQRARAEEMDDLDYVTLPGEKFGPLAWQMTLRGGTTRVAHVGDFHSGLSTNINIRKRELEYVRKSNALAVKPTTKTLRSMTKKTWRDSMHLHERQRMLRRRLKKVRPFDPDVLADMIVRGSDLFDGLLPPEVGPSVTDAEETLDLGAPTPIAEEVPSEGPSVTISSGTDRLYLRSPATTAASDRATITVTNNGTCALYVEWRLDAERASGASDAGLFSTADAAAMLKPGQSLETLFRFDAPAKAAGGAGGASFLAQYTLVTSPPLDPARRAPAQLTLRGVCGGTDTGVRARQAAERRVASREAGGAAGDILRRVVARVKPSEPPESERPRAFYRANRAMRLFYTPKVLAEFRALAQDVLESQTRLVRNSMVWDYSARTIERWIQAIPRRYQDRVRDFQRRYRSLVEKAKVRPPPNPTSYAIVSALLRRLGRAMPRVSRDLRDEAGVPLELSAGDINPHDGAEPLDFNLDAFANTRESLRSAADEGDEDSNGGDDEAGGQGDKESEGRAEGEAKYRAALTDAVRARVTELTHEWLLRYESDAGAQEELQRAASELKNRQGQLAWWCGQGGDADSYGHLIPILNGEGGVVEAAVGCGRCYVVMDDDRVFSWGGDVSEGRNAEKKADADEGEGGEKKIPLISLPPLKLSKPMWGMEFQSMGVTASRIVASDDQGRVWEVEQPGGEAGDTPARVPKQIAFAAPAAEEGKDGDAKEEAGDVQAGAEDTSAGVEDSEQSGAPAAPAPKASAIVSCGGSVLASVALDTNTGKMYSWGESALLGFESAEAVAAPTLVPCTERIVQVAAGDAHFLAVDAKGGVWAWGNGDLAPQGKKPAAGPVVPTVVPFEKVAIAAVRCGSNFSLAITRGGKLFSWGIGESGALGHGSVDNQPTPKCIMSGIPARSRVIDADAGSRHAVAITEKGVYTWGSGDQGALGHGDTEQLLVPTLIQRSRCIAAVRVIAGGTHTIVLGQERDVPVDDDDEDEDEDAQVEES